MAVSNSLQEQTKVIKPTFSNFLIPKKENITQILGQEKTARFISAITSAVSVNPAFTSKDITVNYNTILSGALLGETLGLAHSPQLGQYYLVPFKRKYIDEKTKEEKYETTAQFILGVKGWKQLAIRSGKYKSMNAMPVKQGEYKGLDVETGEPVFQFVANEEEREQLPTVGYMACFRLVDGFYKAIYWSKEKTIKHANTYSQAFSYEAVNTDKMQKVSYEDYIKGKYPKKDEWKYSSFWYKDFDSMACGKVLKKLISDWGVLSIDMQEALDKDERIINQNENGEFIDEDTEYVAVETEINTTNPEVMEVDKIFDSKENKPTKTKTTADDNIDELFG